MALDGRLCISLKPKNFLHEKQLWETHPETKELNEIIHNVEVTVKENLKKINMEELYDVDNSDTENPDDESAYDAKKTSSTEEDNDDDMASDEEGITKNPYALLSKDDN